LTIIVATPLGFILSLVGVIMNKDRRVGVLGLIIAGALVAFALVSSLC
jgi:hypothetical protein